MCSATTATIDDLALTVELEQNETALREYEEEFTPFSDREINQPSGTEDIDVKELFSGSA